MPRNLSGEQTLIATTLHLRKDTYTPGGISTSLQSIYDLFLLLERLKTTGSLDENSDDPVSQRILAAFVRGLHDLCRLKSAHVPVSEVSGLAAFMQAYRPITNDQYSSIQLLDTVPNTYFNLLTRLNEIAGSLGGPRIQRYQVYSEEPQTWFAPNISKSFYRRSSHVALNQEETHFYAPQSINKSFYRRSNHFSIEPENHTWLTATRAANEYTLENADPNGLPRGGVVLKRDGVVVSTIQVVPNPTNQQNMLLSVDSAGTPFYENAGAHTAAHGSGSGSGSGDSYIGSLDFLSSTGHIRAITTNQVTVTTPQSLDDRYYAKADVDAFVATLNGYITALNASIGANALYAQGLNTRLVAVEGAMPTFKFAGGTAQPLLQLQVKTGDFPGTAYYSQSGILKVATSTPPDANPY